MTPITHALLPVALGRRWLVRGQGPDGSTDATRWREVAAVAACGMLPDILSPHLGLAARHASMSHSVYAIGLMALAALLACRGFGVRRALGLLCVGAYALHVGCDAISGGVALWWPSSVAIFGGGYLPYTLWLVSDSVLLVYVYVVYRWLPLRRRLRRDRPVEL